MNVSNAKRNVPKDIKSLKSNFISTTPILCRIEVSHPATRLFHVGQYNMLIVHKQLLFLGSTVHIFQYFFDNIFKGMW